MKRSGTKKRVYALVFILLVVSVIVVINLTSDENTDNGDRGSKFTVAQGDLVISVVEYGNLKAQKSVKIECEVEGQATIVKIVPEGTFVKKNELLVELDASDLEERHTQQEITYESARAAKIQAEEALEIQKNQNESDKAAGELDVLSARDTLQEFLEGSWPQTVRGLEDSIFIAKEELARAEDTEKWTKSLYEKGFVTREDMEADVLNTAKRQIQLKQAEEAKRLAEKYDYPMDKRKLESDFQEAERQLERIHSRARSQLAQKEADLKNRTAQFRLQEERFVKLTEQLEKCNIVAPQDGLVVYGGGGGDDHRRGGSDRIIEEGANVYYRQALITLPDVSVMQVDTKVHESAVDKVGVDMEAIVAVDAFADRSFRGYVSKVGILPDSQSRWLNPDLKVYSTDITLEDGDEKLKPGMSAKVEIIIDRLKNVIYVPIQSVYRRGGREVCYLSDNGHIEVRPVQVGFDNDQFVEILGGLEVGEQVLLHAPMLGEDVEDVEGGAEHQGPRGEVSLSPEEGGGRESSGEKGRREYRTGSRDSDGGSQRGREGRSGPPAGMDFEKIKNMSDEEKKAFFEKMKKEGKIPGSMGGSRPGGGE